MIHHPRWYRKAAERALKTAHRHRRVSRRQKGSNRRRQAVTRRARAHLQGKRQRIDFHQKVAVHLVRPHETIYPDDLRTANRLKRTTTSPRASKTREGAGS